MNPQAFQTTQSLPLSENAPTFVQDGVSYQFVKTEDQSPSLRLWSDEQPPEIMHHSGGALAESIYIYGSLLSETLTRGWLPPKIASVGLGCGYNEWIAIATCLRAGVNGVYLESFESNPILRQTFLAWVLEEWPDDEMPNDPLTEHLVALFSEVLNVVAKQFEIGPTQLQICGRKMLTDRTWVMRERLEPTTQYFKPYTVIFFDAFSTKSTPELWSEEFLADFLSRASAEKCALSTYAATGRLNRALKNAGFELVDYSGFAGKRQSTRAFRVQTKAGF